MGSAARSLQLRAVCAAPEQALVGPIRNGDHSLEKENQNLTKKEMDLSSVFISPTWLGLHILGEDDMGLLPGRGEI